MASVAAGSAILVGLGSVGAFAAGQIGSDDIKDDSVRSRDIHDGTVAAKDLRPTLAGKIGEASQLVGWQTSGWKGNGDSSVVTPDTVRLVLAQGNADGTSVENADLGVPVDAGDQISFRTDLIDGATCSAGGPRMFVKVGEDFYNSFDDQTGCAGDTAPPSTDDGVVTFTVKTAGTISQAGFVYDNSQPGTVEFSDVMIGGRSVTFQQ